MAKYMPIGLLVAVILLIQLAFGLGAWVSAEGAMGLHQAPTPDATQIDNTRALGLLLYDTYLYLFQLAGLILLVAMIGAIVLTLRHRRDIKRQNVLHQMWRDPAKALEMVDVKPGQGL
jgi:NADH-quinone oxidoreductase subunit J